LIHDCSSCSLAEVWFEEGDSDVYLNLNEGGAEEDPEAIHYLEYEGQTIESVRICVTFCPLCGQKLASSHRCARR